MVCAQAAPSRVDNQIPADYVEAACNIEDDLRGQVEKRPAMACLWSVLGMPYMSKHETAWRLRA